jgi:hypothetical protein
MGRKVGVRCLPHTISSIFRWWLPAAAAVVVSVGAESAIASAGRPLSSPGESRLLFDGTRLSDYINQSAPGAVTEVTDPAGDDDLVFEMTVNNEDIYPITPTDNPRAQLLSPPIFRPGEEFWWRAAFFLPIELPSSVPGWLTVLQGPYGPPYAGTPPWHIAASGANLEWQRDGAYGHDIPWQMPLVRGAWINLLLHERFDTHGWVEMWVNGRPVTFFAPGLSDPNGILPTRRLAMKTIDYSNNRGPNSVYIQSYRQAGTLNSVSLYQAPMLIGTTRASVEGPGR